MAHATVAVDLHEPLDVEADVLAEIAFDLPLVGDDLTDLANVVLAQILDPDVAAHAGLVDDPAGARPADSEDVSEANFDPLVERKIYACDTCHLVPCSW